jgi:chromosome segregation ATPase
MPSQSNANCSCQLASYTSDVRDLEGRLTKYLQAATVLAGDAEKLAGLSDKISNTSALGRSTDQARVKSSISDLKEKVEKAKADVASTLAELKAMHSHIEERHKEGANMQSLKKKAETLEGKNDPKASVARGEADRAEDGYNQKHDSSLAELKEWKDNAGSRYSNLFDEVEAVVQHLFH